MNGFTEEELQAICMCYNYDIRDVINMTQDDPKEVQLLLEGRQVRRFVNIIHDSR
jgi:hypothetical protein